ncbi:MAG: STAS domain-containing protein [Pseudomonadota bacterium]
MNILAQLSSAPGTDRAESLRAQPFLTQLPQRSFGNRVRPRYAKRMSGNALQWTSEKRESAIVLSPKGRVDETTADAFKDHLIDAVRTGNQTAVIDLSGIEYMSSRGLRGLTLAQRAADKSGTTIVLASPNDTLREILAISRYDQVFKVTDTIEEATGH